MVEEGEGTRFRVFGFGLLAVSERIASRALPAVGLVLFFGDTFGIPLY